jgi:metal-responsive CopG/Arc/MetJ family transcriptional regulator
MKRTTITMPDDLAGIVEREAQRRRISVSELARDALREHVGANPDAPRVLPFAGIGSSGTRHTARDAEEILAREWGERAGGR